MTVSPYELLLEQATRHLFFTGKGGVGKTSLACATAVTLADRGHAVLLISTDPASNLDAVLDTVLTSSPTPVSTVPRLQALNIDPEAAAQAFRERLVGPYRGLLPPAAIAKMEEQLSGACTMEIAAFEEFARLLGDAKATAPYDYVIFDTAPTGHTLRLLQLPKAWDGFLTTTTGEMSCVGPLAGLQQKRALYAATLAALTDTRSTTIVLVTRPETSTLTEADRTSRELASLGMVQQCLLINGVFPDVPTTDPVAQALRQRGLDALNALPSGLQALMQVRIPLQAQNIVGISALRTLVSAVPASTMRPDASPPVHVAEIALPPLADLVDDIALAGHGVIMTMGKGGVGKTTVAAALAVELAHRGFPVQLTTTDPAAHVQAAVRDAVPGLTVSCIDPAAETEAYREEVLAAVGAELDAEGRALLVEDLRSPCTEEIAVFRAFARVVAQGTEGFVIMDTAPTGHTLLLLDTTETYHREVARNAQQVAPEIVALLPRLRDPAFTRMVLVTLPELTPVQEAQRLQADLQRAGITPFAWVVNQCFALTDSTDPLLCARGVNEWAYITEVVTGMPARTYGISWVPDPPVGREPLRQLLHAAGR